MAWASRPWGQRASCPLNAESRSRASTRQAGRPCHDSSANPPPPLTGGEHHPPPVPEHRRDRPRAQRQRTSARYIADPQARQAQHEHGGGVEAPRERGQRGDGDERVEGERRGEVSVRELQHRPRAAAARARVAGREMEDARWRAQAEPGADDGGEHAAAADGQPEPLMIDLAGGRPAPLQERRAHFQWWPEAMPAPMPTTRRMTTQQKIDQEEDREHGAPEIGFVRAGRGRCTRRRATTGWRRWCRDGNEVEQRDGAAAVGRWRGRSPRNCRRAPPKIMRQTWMMADWTNVPIATPTKDQTSWKMNINRHPGRPAGMAGRAAKGGIQRGHHGLGEADDEEKGDVADAREDEVEPERLADPAIHAHGREGLARLHEHRFHGVAGGDPEAERFPVLPGRAVAGRVGEADHRRPLLEALQHGRFAAGADVAARDLDHIAGVEEASARFALRGARGRREAADRRRGRAHARERGPVRETVAPDERRRQDHALRDEAVELTFGDRAFLLAVIFVEPVHVGFASGGGVCLIVRPRPQRVCRAAESALKREIHCRVNKNRMNDRPDAPARPHPLPGLLLHARRARGWKAARRCASATAAGSSSASRFFPPWEPRRPCRRDGRARDGRRRHLFLSPGETRRAPVRSLRPLPLRLVRSPGRRAPSLPLLPEGRARGQRGAAGVGRRETARGAACRSCCRSFPHAPRHLLLLAHRAGRRFRGALRLEQAGQPRAWETPLLRALRPAARRFADRPGRLMASTKSGSKTTRRVH